MLGGFAGAVLGQAAAPSRGVLTTPLAEVQTVHDGHLVSLGLARTRARPTKPIEGSAHTAVLPARAAPDPTTAALGGVVDVVVVEPGRLLKPGA